jgi:delta 1-pyrroline-5-carboxylate dehydrogenase
MNSNDIKKAIQTQETLFQQWFQEANAARASLLHQLSAASDSSQKAKYKLRLYQNTS